jgi:hypothetical protein
MGVIQHTSFYRRHFTAPVLGKTGNWSFTLFLILSVTLLRSLPSKDPVSAAILISLCALSIPIAVYVGAAQQETATIAVTGAYLLGTSIFVAFLSVGVTDLKKRMGVSDRAMWWLRWGSEGAFVVSYLGGLGVGSEVFTLAVWYAGSWVYGKVRGVAA